MARCRMLDITFIAALLVLTRALVDRSEVGGFLAQVPVPPSHRSVWSGEDEDEPSAIESSGDATAPTYLTRTEAHAVAQGLASVQHVQIMGLFDTGTNLLRSLIEANFPGQVNVYDMYQPHALYWQPQVVNQDRCYDGTMVCSFWKHANLEVIKARSPKRLQQMHDDNVVGIAMIRSPLAWLQGVRKAPYDFGRGNNDVSKGDWLTRGFETAQQWYGGPPVERWSSSSSIWNNNTQNYERLEEYGFRRHLLVRYEDLVMDTEGEMRKIASVLGLLAPSAVTQVEDSAKAGVSQGRDEAIEAIAKKTYQTMFNDVERRDACQRLDADTMRRHGYDDCDENSLRQRFLRLIKVGRELR